MICFLWYASLWASGVIAKTDYYGTEKGNIIQVVDDLQKGNPIVQSVFEDKVRTYANGGTTWFGKENRLANGAWILVEAVGPYINRAVYIGMSLSVILIIYNGLMVVVSVWDDSKIKSAKENITNILIGVWILSWFYFIMKLVSGLLINLIWW